MFFFLLKKYIISSVCANFERALRLLQPKRNVIPVVCLSRDRAAGAEISIVPRIQLCAPTVRIDQNLPRRDPNRATHWAPIVARKIAHCPASSSIQPPSGFRIDLNTRQFCLQLSRRHKAPRCAGLIMHLSKTIESKRHYARLGVVSNIA